MKYRTPEMADEEINELEIEIERLESKLDQVTRERDTLLDDPGLLRLSAVKVRQDKIQELQSQLNRYREALEQYADPANWAKGRPSPLGISVAREALAGKEPTVSSEIR